MLQQKLDMLDRLIANKLLQQAVVVGEQLCGEHPTCIPAWLSLSEAYRRQGGFERAKERAATAYNLDPANDFARAQYVRSLIPFADHRAIVSLLELHLSSAGGAAWADEMMASAAASVDEWQLALSCYERLLKAQPGHQQALYMRGVALSILGLREDAITTFGHLVSANPGHGRAWWSLADLDLAAVDKKLLLSLVNSKKIPDMEKIYLWQVLGQLHQGNGKYAEAFECWESANRTRRTMQIYQQIQWEDLVKTLGKTPPLSSVNDPLAQAEKPIFIVGLPRSGSTLVEQLISNSGEVKALGELRDIEVLLQQAAELDPRPLPFNLSLEASESLVPADIGAAYINRIRSRCQTGRFCDKNPFNFLFLGIILQAFPEARIVHVFKHPMDVCLGVFKHQFAAAAPWSYALTDIAHFYILYHKMMSRWERVYPGRIYHLSYEALLEDPDRETRRVFEYCKLNWTSEVMDLKFKKGAVLSASANQVREGVHARALFAHKNFEMQLAPFRQALLEAGIQPDAICQFEVKHDR